MWPALHLTLTEFIIVSGIVVFLAFPAWLLQLVYVIETIGQLWGKGAQ